MTYKQLLTLILVLFSKNILAQFNLTGVVKNTSLEPVQFATVSIKELKLNTQTNKDGAYSFTVEEGKYDLVVTMTGYKPQLITLVVNGKNIIQNIIIEETRKQGEEVQVFAIRKDRWREIMTNVIRNKENYLAATSNYSCNVYIRATEENEKTVFKKRKHFDSLLTNRDEDKQSGGTLNSMGEIVLQLDKTEPDKIKETRTGVRIRGNIDNLFYTRTTEGNFSIYQNLIKVPALSDVPMLSPISNAGLNAYNFKTIRLKKKNGRKYYTITFTPVKAGNALIEGEIEVMDSLWVVTEAKYNFPNYLIEQYDYFGVYQEYDSTETGMYLLKKQDLTYVNKIGKNVSTGRTLAMFSNYNIDPKFSKRYFTNELSVTSEKAYEQDSIFWEQVRQEPLTLEQLQFIRYNDSVARAHSTQAYLDSIDKVFNKITLGKIFFKGQGFYSRSKDRSLFLEPIINFVQPLQFAGTRLKMGYDYHKTYGSKKQEAIWGDINFGLKNRDLKGELKVRKLYNTFSRAAYELNIGRTFTSLFSNGSWQDQLKRSGIYEKDDIGTQHEIELFNGFNVINRVDMSFRRDATRYNLNTDSFDVLWGVYKFRPSDTPIAFPSYQGLFNTITLQYTPQQKYIREPREKIILGSKWPTFSITWRKGIPKLLGSEVNYDYVEYRIDQKLNLKLLGVSQYNFTSGKFINRDLLREPDYKFIRQGDKFVFLNPNNTFQAMDNAFPVFNRFYEFHWVHNFNGFILNRIPFMKKLRVNEIVGGGFFYSKERNLQYFEGFVGIEKNIKLFNDRYKVGVFLVGTKANLFETPLQLKFSFNRFNRRKATWY